MPKHEIEQNSPEWFELRRGKFTASTFFEIMQKTDSVGYKKAIYKVAYEIVSGKSVESYSNEHMERGKELEEIARAAYEWATGNNVEPGGFFDDGYMVGCSPDGLVGEDGLIEIKCPAYNTHIEYLQGGKVPSKYLWQMQGQIMLTGREWCDFVSYHPDMKLLVIRVERDNEMIDRLDENILSAIAEVVNLIPLLK